MVTRRTVTRRVVGAATLILVAGALSSCDRTGEVETTHEPVDGPSDPDQALALADLAPAPEVSEPTLAPVEPADEFELWAVEVSFTAQADAVEDWVAQSWGPDDGPGPAHVTFSEAKRAFGIGDVPDTWRLADESVVGTPYQRIVLIDDQDPRTVRVHIAEVGD